MSFICSHDEQLYINFLSLCAWSRLDIKFGLPRVTELRAYLKTVYIGSVFAVPSAPMQIYIMESILQHYDLNTICRPRFGPMSA